MDGVRTGKLVGILWLIVIVVSFSGVAFQSSAPRLAFAMNQLSGVVYLGVTVLLYQLFKPVNRDLSLFAFCCGVAGVAAGAALSLNTSTTLTQGFYIAMMFFGFQMMSVGYLITRSLSVPKVLGVLLLLGGLSYDAAALASFLGVQLPLFIIPVAVVGEGSLSVWLVAKGVRSA